MIDYPQATGEGVSRPDHRPAPAPIARNLLMK